MITHQVYAFHIPPQKLFIFSIAALTDLSVTKSGAWIQFRVK